MDAAGQRATRLDIRPAVGPDLDQAGASGERRREVVQGAEATVGEVEKVRGLGDVDVRSALLRDREARLFAGSDPAAELEETEIKLQALLPLVAE